MSAQSATQNADAIAKAIDFSEAEKWDKAIDVLTGVLRTEPDNLRARYLRGIAYREAEKGTTLQSHSLADFEFVVARDSLFDDVLLQYAQTLCYRDQYPDDVPRAIALEEAWRRQKQEPLDPGRFSAYRYLVRTKSSREALVQLRKYSSDYARYYQGEALRRQGLTPLLDRIVADNTALREADTILAELGAEASARPFQVPVQAVLLSRARIHYLLEQPERAQTFLEEAIASIDGEEAGRVVFNDFKYIVDDDELQEYLTLDSPAAYRAFFRRMWVRRDPTPSRAFNVRLEEHYRRLIRAEVLYPFTGFRARYNNPDRFQELVFPAVHALAPEFDDRGLVYIRHGEPKEIVRHPDTMHESWHYVDPLMDFHFSSQTMAFSSMWPDITGVGNQRLTPLPSVRLDDILLWSSSYMGLQKDRDLVRDEVIRQSRAFVQQGLSTDRHTWPAAVTLLEIPHLLTSFRGDSGRTQFEIHFALPVEQLSHETSVDVGVALHNAMWQKVADRTERRHLPPHADPSAAAIDLLRLDVPPDSYHVAFHARYLDTPWLGAEKIEVQLPDFTTTRLAMSDVLPAYRVSPAGGADRYNRGTLHIQANPFRRFSVRQPVYVYFEIYDLTIGADDRAHYMLEYALRSQNDRNLLGRLFGRGREVALSLRTEAEGRSTTSIEYPSIDVSSVPPGRYQLTITVTDINTGETVERTLPMELTR